MGIFLHCKVKLSEIMAVQREAYAKYVQFTKEKKENPIIQEGHAVKKSDEYYDALIAEAKEDLKPVELSRVILPQYAIVRIISSTYITAESSLTSGKNYILIGEVAQQPGTVLVLDPENNTIHTGPVDWFEIVPVTELN